MNKWISVNDYLPKLEQEVRLFCKSKHYDTTYQCQGFYIPKQLRIESCQYLLKFESYKYQEETDDYYTQPGWYERIYNLDDYDALAINDEVLYWMPLPKNPKGWNKR